MKEKSVTFCFFKLKAKEKANRQNDQGEADISVENLCFFFFKVDVCAFNVMLNP